MLEKSLPDRNALGSAMLATRAVARAGPTPGISSSRRLVSLERCQAVIIRSNSRIGAFSIRELGTQRDDTSTCERGQPFIARISGDPEELFNAVASDRCDDAELSQMRADGIGSPRSAGG